MNLDDAPLSARLCLSLRMMKTDDIAAAVTQLAKLVEENNLSELRYEEGDTRITLRTAAFSRPAPVSPVTAPAQGGASEAHSLTLFAPPTPEAVTETEADSLIRIEAPMMGVFYRSASQGVPPFVEVGDTVEIGDTIGLIEAMKVFSEVPSEYAGRVTALPVKSGALVQPGDPLAILEPKE